MRPKDTATRRRAWSGFAVLLLAAGSATTCGVVAAGDKSPVAAAPPQAALTVTLVQPQRLMVSTTVVASGNVAAWQEAIIGAEANGWRLSEVRAQVGDAVRRGQLLASFVSELAQAELAQSQGAVAEAEATLAEAVANAQRARELQPSGALSAQQVSQYLTAERTAQARLQALRAAARVQALRLAQAQVLAPDDGIISARSATLGAVVPAGTELFRLIRLGRLEWRAEVAAGELAQIRPGQTVRVTAAGGAVVSGRSRTVAPTVDAATRNGLVYVDLPQPGALRAGMFARGEFVIGSAPALTLPQSAVLMRDGFSYVFRLAAANKVVQTRVSVGRSAGERIEITGGLDADARVVAVGAAFLSDGDTVHVVESAPAIERSGPR
jgi:RND family efflux transporter MFP subunit